jgi:hypothetical protein
MLRRGEEVLVVRVDLAEPVLAGAGQMRAMTSSSCEARRTKWPVRAWSSRMGISMVATVAV